MPSRRAQKVAEAIREVVSMAILAEMKDPRVQDVTVTYVEVAGDLRSAKVHVSVMGDEAKQRLAVHGLTRAAGFLQARCAARIDMRYTPRLQFLLDQGVKKSIAIAKILSEVLPKPAPEEPLPEEPLPEEPLPEEPLPEEPLPEEPLPEEPLPEEPLPEEPLPEESLPEESLPEESQVQAPAVDASHPPPSPDAVAPPDRPPGS